MKVIYKAPGCAPEPRDIPCVRCGAPNTVTYNPGRDCYGPVGSTHRKTKPRKKK